VRLLVSVRSAAEAVAALDGAAHIVDAKEPAHGPLGAVDPAVLAAIMEQVPPGHPFSVALGDFTTAKDVYASVVALPQRRGPTFVKIGFAGAGSSEHAEDKSKVAAKKLIRICMLPSLGRKTARANLARKASSLTAPNLRLATEMCSRAERQGLRDELVA